MLLKNVFCFKIIKINYRLCNYHYIKCLRVCVNNLLACNAPCFFKLQISKINRDDIFMKETLKETVKEKRMLVIQMVHWKWVLSRVKRTALN